MDSRPPPIHGILESALYVDDVERSADFYRSLFRFEEVSRGERLIALSAGERQILLLFKKRASLDRPLTPHDGDGQLHLAFAIPAEELTAWESRLGQFEIAIIERTVWPLGGVSLYFRDPDGHLIELATPGVWRTY